MDQHSEATTLAVPVTHLDHVLGLETARVTLVEYGDFECPNCGQAYPAVKILRKHFGERMRFVFRHFPLREVHPHAKLAAEAAEAAGAQSKFWPMHGLLFENQLHLKAKSLRRYAEAFLPDDVAPMASMVVILFPAAVETGVMQDRVSFPSM